MRMRYVSTMKKFLPLLLLLSSPALADSPRDAVQRLSACVSGNDAAACREEVTASSVSLYDRFAKYRLMHCLPQPVRYESQKTSGAHRIVRASAPTGESRRFFRLWMVEEEGGWKLDIPASLKASLGENWQKTVDGTEALYLLMKKQLGDKLGCAMIQGMAEDKVKNR